MIDQGLIERRLGVPLITTWIALVLYTYELMLAVRYFASNRKSRLADAKAMRVVVVSLVLLDTVAMGSNCAAIYLSMAKHWGDLAWLLKQHWPLPLFIFATGVSGAVVHVFLLRRVWHLLPKTIVLVPLSLIAAASLAGAIATSVIVWQSPSPSFTIPRTNKTTIIWLACTAGTDLALAATLVARLYHVREKVANFEQSQLREPLLQLIRTTIETGTVTALCALIVLILYFTTSATTAVAVSYWLSHLYSITLLTSTTRHRNTPSTLSGSQVAGVNSTVVNFEESMGEMRERARRATATGSIPGAGHRSETTVVMVGNQRGQRYSGRRPALQEWECENEDEEEGDGFGRPGAGEGAERIVVQVDLSQGDENEDKEKELVHEAHSAV
ncbi:hypothetical protein T439DRAFT_325577 [Meredithblackwellia eburnea MCA 4105]